MYIVQTCMYIVQTCMYYYKHVYTRFESYKQVHTVYKHVYASFVQLMFHVQMATYIS